MLGFYHSHSQPVSRVLLICSHAQRRALVNLAYRVAHAFAYPVFAYQVVVHALMAFVSRSYQFEIEAVGRGVSQCQRAELGLENVFLLSVEVHAECPYVAYRSVRCGAAFGYVVVDVSGEVTQEVNLPFLGEVECEVSLVVEELLVVCSFCVKGVEHVVAALVSYAVQLRELAVFCAVSYVSLRAEKASGYRCLESFRLLVLYVKHRRHLVAVRRAVAASRKFHGFHHVRVDEAQTFLLAGPYEQWAIHLDVVHIDAVLVVVAAPHAVLAGQLVPVGHSGVRAYQSLDSAVDARHHIHLAHVYLVHGCALLGEVSHLDVLHHYGVIFQIHHLLNGFSRLWCYFVSVWLTAEYVELDVGAVCRAELQFIVSVLSGCRSCGSAFHAYGCETRRLSVGQIDVAVYLVVIGVCVNNRRQC